MYNFVLKLYETLEVIEKSVLFLPEGDFCWLLFMIFV